MKNFAVMQKQPERDKIAEQMAAYEQLNGKVETIDIKVRTQHEIKFSLSKTEKGQNRLNYGSKSK